MSCDLLRFCYLFFITCTANLPEYGATSLPAKTVSNKCTQVLFFTAPVAHKCPSRGTFVWKGSQCLHTNLTASSSHLALPLHLSSPCRWLFDSVAQPHYTSAQLTAVHPASAPTSAGLWHIAFSLFPPTRNTLQMQWAYIWYKNCLG